LLDRGRAVFDGDPRECLASPQMQQVYFGVAEADDEADDEANDEADEPVEVPDGTP
jgi:branched-chain amino acid transport system ATP-binding protein